MNEKEIRVNNSEELIAKIKELVAEDGTWKLIEEYCASSIIFYEPDGREKTIKKPHQGVKLANQQQELNIYWERAKILLIPPTLLLIMKEWKII